MSVHFSLVRRRMKKRRWIIKAGSQMVCGGGPLLLRAWMAQVAELRDKHGIEVIWVSPRAASTRLFQTVGAIA